MAKYLLFLFFTLSSGSSIAQITFQKTSTIPSIGRFVKQTSDKGYLIVGQIWNPSPNNIDIMVMKTDEYGNTLWSKSFGAANVDVGLAGLETPDSGFVILAHITANPSGIYLIRLNSLGDSLWTNVITGLAGVTYDPLGKSIIQTSDGGLFIVGNTYVYGGNHTDVFIAKTDSMGNLQWTKTHGIYTREESAQDARITSDEGLIIAGPTESYTSGLTDGFVIKTNSFGDTIWTRLVGGFSYDELNSIQQTFDGGYIAVGETESFGYGIYLVKLDSTGSTQWSKTYSDTLFHGYWVEQTADSGFILLGTIWDSSSTDICLIKTNMTGDTLWKKSYGGSNADEGYYVQQTFDGGYIITGSSQSFQNNSGYLYLIKTDAHGNSGCFETNHTLNVNSLVSQGTNFNDSITTSSGAINATFSTDIGASDSLSNLCLTLNVDGMSNDKFFELFPNPTLSTFSILSHEDIINSWAEIFNIVGKKIYSTKLTSQQQVINTEFSSGIYIVKVRNGEKQFIKRIIVQ